MSATTESTTPVVVPPRLGDPYQPRPVRFIRLDRSGDWRLKVYGIHVADWIAAGSPAMTWTSTEALGSDRPEPTRTAPGSAPAPSSFASCSASIPLTTIGPT